MPNYAPAGTCLVCNITPMETSAHDTRDARYVRCLNCGDHLFSGSAYANLRNGNLSEDQRALLAHRVYRTKADTLIGADQVDAMIEVGQLPTAAECIDNLVLYLAGKQRPGVHYYASPNVIVAALGVVSSLAACWVVAEALNAGWVEATPHPDLISAIDQCAMRLTAKGWERHRQLMREGVGSRHAFMAMDFKEPDIRTLFSQHLVAGVMRTDFELRTTEHAQKTAGLIDARMRVELHTSRFVVCDLTHNNRGAYWEAGFAEGIGRPVFYLCRADVLNSQDPESKPHFDIAHQAIVKWDPANPGAAVDELVAMIRATLPHEAKMEDSDR